MNKAIDFIPEQWDRQRRIIIYGASKYGEIAYYLLQYYGLKPSYYCDRSIVAKAFFDIPVITPKELVRFKDDVILVASADYFNEICDLLEEQGFNEFYSLSYMLDDSLIDTNILSNRARDIYQNRQNYIDVATCRGDGLSFTRIQFVVTERCSLKCKDCTHLMQYYRDPKDVDLEKYRQSFELLLDVTDYISEVRILGGEPFMNKDMYKVIEWWHDNPKIGVFTIFTNGTIVPSEKCLQVLLRKKVRVRISDYKINSEQIEKLVRKLDEYGITYYVTQYDSWQDAGDLHFRKQSVRHMQKIFSNCFERNCITFFRGQLHRCPRSAHAMNLKAMPDITDDYVDIFNWKGGNQELVDCINKLQYRTWIMACNYCDGLNNKMQHIKPAEQTNKPLEI